MTNRSKFRVGNIGHAGYFAVGKWLSNFYYSFSNPFWHLQFNNGVFTKTGESRKKERNKCGMV